MAVPVQSVFLVSVAWIFSHIPATTSDLCTYTTYSYRTYGNFMVQYRNCQWGCCQRDYTNNPCCSAPLGLILGVLVASLISLALIILGICCVCCMCRRRRRNKAMRGAVVRYSTQPRAGVQLAVAQGEATPHSTMVNTSLTPGVYLPPPSYDEVMREEANSVFKPGGAPLP